MLIKQFRALHVRVPDPLRPGRHVMEERLIPTGNTALSHDGKRYTCDAKGWTEVPHEVGETLRNFHGQRGERFMTPEEVGEHISFGVIDTDEMPDAPPKSRAAAKASD